MEQAEFSTLGVAVWMLWTFVALKQNSLTYCWKLGPKYFMLSTVKYHLPNVIRLFCPYFMSFHNKLERLSLQGFQAKSSKNSSLVQKFVNYRQKSFVTLALGSINSQPLWKRLGFLLFKRYNLVKVERRHSKTNKFDC